jgi:ACS family tartrate transporter-like MFS transporter
MAGARVLYSKRVWTRGRDCLVTLRAVLPIDDDGRAATYAKIRWRIAPFLILLYVVAFLDRVNISFASLSMNRDLRIQESLFGLGAGIFFVGYLLFAIPSNLMLVRFGARSWIAIIMVVWGVLSTSMAFVQGASFYILFRFLLGAAEAGFFPGMILYLTRWLPGKARAGLVALFVVSIPLSIVIGAPLSNWILSLGGHGGLKGWQWLFLLEGIPAVLLGLIVPLLLAEGPEEVRWLTREEKSGVRQALEEDGAASGGDSVKLSLRVLFAEPAVFGYAFQYFALMIGLYALGFWVPRILSSRGVAAVSLGWLTAVPFAFGTVGMLVCSRHSDRSGERKWHIFGSFVLGAIGIGIAAPVQHWVVSLGGLSLAAVGIFSAMPIFWTAVTQSVDARLSALTIAFVNSVGNIGGFVGPLLIGSVLQHTASYTYGLLFTSGSLLCGALILSRTTVGGAPLSVIDHERHVPAKAKRPRE